jgi:hypothetical protein
VKLSRREVVFGSISLGLLPSLPTAARAEPIITTAVVVGAIVTAAISFVVERSLAAAMGGYTLVDVHTWIREAVAEIEAYTKNYIDGTEIGKMEAAVSGFETQLRTYAAMGAKARRTNRYLIENCDNLTSSLVPLSVKYREAFYIALAAMSFRIITVAGLVQGDKQSAHVSGMTRMMDDFLISIHRHYTALLQNLEPDQRIKILCDEDPGGPPQADGLPPEPGYYFCWCTLDSQDVGEAGTFTDERDKDYAFRLAKNWADANVRPNIQNQFDTFKKDGKALISGTFTAFSDLCQQVEVAYKPPSAALEKLLSEAKAFSFSVQSQVGMMPGALTFPVKSAKQ